MIKITAISDLHGFYPQLPGGDLLIVAGDLTATDEPKQYFKFFHWIANTNYRKRIVIAGNHDFLIEEGTVPMKVCADFEYLQDSGTEFEGIKIWGSPWSYRFPGMNPICAAFTCPLEQQLKEKWALIPDDTDILITHCPPKGVMDSADYYGRRCGSISLWERVEEIGPSIHAFGHIHEGYGKAARVNPKTGFATLFLNCAHVDRDYRPVNEAHVFETMKREDASPNQEYRNE